MDSCETSGIEVFDHFREVTKMVPLGSGAHRSVKDYMLTRYACYLIAQNGNSDADYCSETQRTDHGNRFKIPSHFAAFRIDRKRKSIDTA